MNIQKSQEYFDVSRRVLTWVQRPHPQMEKNSENELNEARKHMELFPDLYYIDLY